MGKTTDDLYLEIVKYGFEHAKEGFQVIDLINHLKKAGYNGISETSISLVNIVNSTTFSTSNLQNFVSDFRFINSVAYFGYLQYMQLIESKKANKLAWYGVALALVASLYPIISKIFFN